MDSENAPTIHDLLAQFHALESEAEKCLFFNATENFPLLSQVIRPIFYPKPGSTSAAPAPATSSAAPATT